MINDIGFELKPSNSLIMMPKLQQAIHMLQLNNLELMEFISYEVEKNPFLIKKNTKYSSFPKNDSDDFFRNIAYKESIYDILEHEIRLFTKSDEEYKIGLYILMHTNAKGIIDLNERSIAYTFNCSIEKVNSVIMALQNSSLIGFFSKNLKESIKIKLKNQDKLTKVISEIVDNIDILYKNNIHALSKKCNMSLQSVIDGLLDISKIRPFNSFVDDDLVAVKIPDVIIKEIDEDKWSIKLNEETLPRILMDYDYESFIFSEVKSEKDKRFVKENLLEANFLIKSLNQRAKTILNVAKSIFTRQKMFFLYGEEFLVPMTLKNIADDIKVHESTVSRAVMNKFMMTRFGTFEMKSLFSNSLKDFGDCDISGKIIKQKIVKAIKTEDKMSPLSDKEIVHLLCSDGINIARRTVSKYRSFLNIPNSNQRKKIIQ